jgi:hypothetical protein
MKKLNLKLSGKEMLTKEQMKKITGGDSTCWLNYNNNQPPFLVECMNLDVEECERYVWEFCIRTETCAWVTGCVNV